MDTTCFLFSDRVLIYGIAKAGVLNRFVDIVVHILRLLYLDYYIYLDLFGLYWCMSYINNNTYNITVFYWHN